MCCRAGKTSVAVGLQHLFGFGHVQSDDITSKKAAPIFIKHVTQALKKHDVVIADKCVPFSSLSLAYVPWTSHQNADSTLTLTPLCAHTHRNNHLKQHRTQLRDAASKFAPPAHLLALHWPLADLPRATLHRLCAERIAARGDRHQTLHAGAHERVLWQFLDNAEELRDAEVDAVVSMDPEEPLEDALARAAGQVATLLGRERPDAENMGRALAAARAYEPRVKGGNKKGGKQKAAEDAAEAEEKERKREEKERGKGKPPRYYGVLAEVDLQAVVAPALDAASAGLPSEAKKFWEKLVQGKRVQGRPHITLVHSKQLPDPSASALWERCRAVDALERGPLLRFRLGDVVWNERIMAVTVVDVAVADNGEGEGGEEAVKFVELLEDEVKERLHVTVGTRDKSVPPVEAKDMVVGWKRKGDKKAGVWSVPLVDVWAKGRVKGLFQ